MERERSKCRFNCRVVVVTLFASLAFIPRTHYDDTEISMKSRKFDDAMDQMRISFPRQTARFWRILRNKVSAHTGNPRTKKPLVVVFTAPPSAYSILECITLKIARSLGPETDIINPIRGTEYQNYSSFDVAKKILDETIEQRLEKRHPAVILNVDRLPAQCALLFYKYCDYGNAPYTYAAILFTVRLPEEPGPSFDPAKAEGLVVKHLKEIWGKQDDKVDNIPPLVTRVTDTVVQVNEEREETITENCAS